jgi:hypothetical protein
MRSKRLPSVLLSKFCIIIGRSIVTCALGHIDGRHRRPHLAAGGLQAQVGVALDVARLEHLALEWCDGRRLGLGLGQAEAGAEQQGGREAGQFHRGSPFVSGPMIVDGPEAIP